MTRHRVCFKCKKIYDYPKKPDCNHKTYQYNTKLRNLPSFNDSDEQIFEDENNEAKA